MEFKKGDAAVHYFKIPAANWSAGGTLWFAAKTKPDADLTDAAAVINKSFTDSVVTNETIDDVSYKVYTLAFNAEDTSAVSFSDGSTKKRYLGEFQFVPLNGDPISFPADNHYINVIVYADIKRAVA